MHTFLCLCAILLASAAAFTVWAFIMYKTITNQKIFGDKKETEKEETHE